MINPDSPFDGTGMPNTAEWVEIHNICSTPIDASCYVITDGDFTLTIPSGTIIGPDDYFTLGSLNSSVPIDLNWGTCGCTTNAGQVGIFTNSGEQLALVDENGQLLDGVYWGNGQFPINISSGGVGCSMQNISFANSASFTNIPYTNQQACTVSIDCNGVWAETCGNTITPDANNGIGSPLILIEATSTSICAGNCIDLSFTGSGASAWNWTLIGSSTTNSNLENPTSICYDNPGVYDIMLEVDGPCGTDSYTATGFIQVTPNTAPIIATSAPAILCTGETTEILSVDGSALNWFHDGAMLGVGTSWSVSESGDYWATQGSSGCDAPSNTITLNFTPSPSISISANQITGCAGDEIPLTATAGMDSYEWSLNGVVLNQINGNTCDGSTSGIYTVESTLNGCAGSGSIELSFAPLPSGSVSPTGGIAFCEGSATPLLCAGSFESIQWFYNGTSIINATNASFIPTASGSYSAALESAGCTYETSGVDVTILPLPDFVWNNPASQSTCQQELTIQISAASEVQWYLNGEIIAGATNEMLIATTSGSYSCVIDPMSACAIESPACDILLDIPLNLELTLPNDTLCEGEQATITAEFEEGSLTWNDGTENPWINVFSSGIYWAQVEAGNCTARDTVEVTFLERPTADAGEDLISDCGVGMLIDAECLGNCHWEFEQTTIDFTEPMYLPSPNRSTTYLLIADNGFCAVQDTLFIWADCIHVYVPNAFTPDGDGINDVLEVFTSGIDQIQFSIYDRWGTRVYYSESDHPVWTGGLDGYYVPDGVYPWRIEAIDIHLQGFVREGSILIAR